MAAKQLLQRSTRAGLTAGVLVVAMSNGLGLGSAIINNVDDIREWYRHALTGDAFLFDPSAADRAGNKESREALRAEIAQVPAVESVTEERYLPTRVNGITGICVLRNYPPQTPLPWALDAAAETQLRSALKNGEVAVSHVLARKLKVGVGDTLRLELRGRIISGRVASLVREYVLGGMIVSLDADFVAKQLDIGAADAYVVRAAPNTSPAELAQNLDGVVNGQGLSFTSVTEMRAGLDRMVNTVVAPLWAVMALGFVVGGAAVANTLMMSVFEQTRELGLLRVVGMTRGGIRTLVFWESLLLGTFGGFMGLLAGLVTAYVIHLCNEPLLGYHVPFKLHTWLIAANVVGCLLIAILAAFSPGARAAHLDLRSAIAYD
jgi:putative ABC transport system permease protein